MARAVWGGCGPRGVAPAPSWLLTSVLRAFPPACLPGALLSSPMGSVRSRSAVANPARLYKAPAGPFGKRISFFLDAFPDLGIMEGLRAARAWAKLREEEPGSSGPQPRAGNQSTPSQDLARGPLGQAHNLRLGRLTIFFFCHRSRRRRSVQGREEPWLGAAEPCGTKR